MIIVKGEAVGSGVPRDKRGVPATAERTTEVPVSPSVARSVKKARSKPAEEPAKPEPVQEPVQEPVLTETEQEADLQAAESREPEEVEGPPKDYASKADWVDYAVSRGADRDEAETLTKAELIDLHGGD